MHLSLEAVQSLTGMTIDAKVFVTSAEDVDRKAMETNDAKLRFLRRHTWEELAGQLGYSDGVVNGEPATFRDWVDQLMPSKLAADPTVAGLARVDEAIALLADLTHRDTLADFLTLPAYERID